MNYLIDTQVLVHYLKGSHKLPRNILDYLSDYNNIGHVSVVTLHELVIKKEKKHTFFSGSLQNVILPHINEANLEIIPINYHHVIRLETLERESIHKDPFDRLLIAQCIEEKLTFITSDSKVALYEKYGLDYIQYELN
jgi:PIN domain nuclease of toxin-antitoxin system